MDIDLTCTGCPGGAPAPPDGAAVGFWGCVRWLAEGSGDLDRRPLLARPPVIGATYTLEVSHPFHVDHGADVWVAFEPGEAVREGWARHARLLPAIGVARLRPRRFMGATSDRGPAEARRGWVVARVEELVYALDLPNRFPREPRLPVPELAHPWPPEDTAVVESGTLALVTCTLPRGQRRRAVVLQSPLALPSLVMLEEVGFHEARLLAGVRPLTAREAGHLRDPADAFPMRWR